METISRKVELEKIFNLMNEYVIFEIGFSIRTKSNNTLIIQLENITTGWDLRINGENRGSYSFQEIRQKLLSENLRD